MSQYNSVYVDEAYSPIVVANLRKDTFLVDGVTYNSGYSKGDPAAGVVHFYKYSRQAIASAASAADFSSAEPTNALVPVYLANAFRNSKKLYQVTANSISHAYADQVMSEQTEDIREGRELCAIAALKYGAQVSTDTVASTSATIKQNIQDDLTDLRKQKCRPNVLVMSPDAWGLLMTAQIGTASVVTPETNDELLKNGSMGKLFGMSVFVDPELQNASNTAVIYRDSEARTVALNKCEYIMYDSKYFAAIDNLNYVKVMDSQTFAGSLSNIELNSGFKLMVEEAAIAKVNELEVGLTVSVKKAADGLALDSPTVVIKENSSTGDAITATNGVYTIPSGVNTFYYSVSKTLYDTQTGTYTFSAAEIKAGVTTLAISMVLTA